MEQHFFFNINIYIYKIKATFSFCATVAIYNMTKVKCTDAEQLFSLLQTLMAVTVSHHLVKGCRMTTQQFRINICSYKQTTHTQRNAYIINIISLLLFVAHKLYLS